MAFRLKLVPEKTSIDFFRAQKITFGFSVVMVIAALVVTLMMGMNFLGDVVISEVFDPGFRDDQHVVTLRIQAQEGEESITPGTISAVLDALRAVSPEVQVTSTESVGPKVSGELIQTAIWSVLAAVAAILIYIWLRFEWQFAVGAVAALVHDVMLTIGIFAVLQLRFDLSIIAALLTILGYSINDTVVVFDRLRENLIKYKTMPLREVMNLSVNETLARTVMTSGTTLIVLIAMLVLGGDVIRNFVFAMTWGVVVGTYSSVYVAKNVVLFIGLDRNKEKKDPAEKFFDRAGNAAD